MILTGWYFIHFSAFCLSHLPMLPGKISKKMSIALIYILNNCVMFHSVNVLYLVHHLNY